MERMNFIDRLLVLTIEIHDFSVIRQRFAFEQSDFKLIQRAEKITMLKTDGVTRTSTMYKQVCINSKKILIDF